MLKNNNILITEIKNIWIASCLGILDNKTSKIYMKNYFKTEEMHEKKISIEKLEHLDLNHKNNILNLKNGLNALEQSEKDIGTLIDVLNNNT
jgi:hypothetical protein